MYWLIIMAVMIVLEIISLGLTTIWFAIGALAAYIVALFCNQLIVQIIVFLVVSIIALVFTRPVAIRFINGKKIEKTNVDRVIGKKAKVIEQIDNDRATGRVLIDGQEWMARSENDEIIGLDERVIIKEISGVKLIVYKMEKEEKNE